MSGSRFVPVVIKDTIRAAAASTYRIVTPVDGSIKRIMLCDDSLDLTVGAVNYFTLRFPEPTTVVYRAAFQHRVKILSNEEVNIPTRRGDVLEVTFDPGAHFWDIEIVVIYEAEREGEHWIGESAA